jgi:hypothetical protein
MTEELPDFGVWKTTRLEFLLVEYTVDQAPHPTRQGGDQAMRELVEKFWTWLAWRLPRGLVYWCAIRVLTDGHALGPDERKVSEALQAWRVKE